MGYRIATFEASVFGYIEVCAGLEEKRSAEINTLGNCNYTSAVSGSKIYNFLDCLGLNQGRVAFTTP